ncbi:MAG TPA: 2OG-Fe(II) oxygenase [Lysobacter sp.]
MLAERIGEEQATRAVARELTVHGGLGATAVASCWPPGFAFRFGNRATVGDREIHVVARLERPSAVLLENVLSEEECAHLVMLSTKRLRPSPHAMPDSAETSAIRAGNSARTGVPRGHDAVVTAVEARLAELMQVPVAHGEGLQVRRYLQGGEHRPGYDYFPPRQFDSARHLVQGGQRTASLILYLNSPEAGGETVFPLTGLSCVPRAGSALYFAYCDGAGRLDASSLHGGAPVVSGEKWIATKWVREGPCP